MFSIPVAVAAKALMTVTISLHPAAAHHGQDAYTVRSGDTCLSLAELYYGDRLRCEVNAETNRLALNVALRPGHKLKIPEIPGVPFQLR